MAEINGKATFKNVDKFTKEYCEENLISWARNIWENIKELFFEKYRFCPEFEDTKLQKAFMQQFSIGSSFNNRYEFPSEDTLARECQYSNKEEYLSGTMTEKEHIIRKTFCLIEEIVQLHSLYQKEPVFDVIATGINKDVELSLGIVLIKFGTSDALCLPRELFKVTEYIDYTSFSSKQLTDNLANGISSAAGLMDITGKSVLSIKEERENLDTIKKQLDTEREDINCRRVPELAELQEQIDKMQAQLNEKMSSLREELSKKQVELTAKQKQLENELFVVETQIYSLRCQNGEVYEVMQLKSGADANIDTPVTLFQKVKYMDNELGYLASVYNVDASVHKIFERLLTENPIAFETFCPTEKCIVIMRATEHSRYASYTRGEGFNFYEKYHGNQTAILLRNGENLYVIWTDDEHININGNAFYQAGKQYQEQIKDVHKVDTKEERASRIFLMNILQGVFDSGRIFSFPEKVNLLMPTPYIAFSYADAYVTDNRFGSLVDIQKKCNWQITKGDIVVLLTDLYDSKHYGHNVWTGRAGWEDCERSRGDSNRTNDCKLKKDTLYNINLVEDVDEERCYYIRATKTIWTGSMRWGYEEKETGANFRIYPSEILNLTYANSVWLEYVLVNRNIGHMSNSSSSKDTDYAGLVKALKVAKEHVLEREQKEKELIEKYLEASLDNISEWQVTLSEWKIQNKVRTITDYQAKRFAKSLTERR